MCPHIGGDKHMLSDNRRCRRKNDRRGFKSESASGTQKLVSSLVQICLCLHIPESVYEHNRSKSINLIDINMSHMFIAHHRQCLCAIAILCNTAQQCSNITVDHILSLCRWHLQADAVTSISLFAPEMKSCMYEYRNKRDIMYCVFGITTESEITFHVQLHMQQDVTITVCVCGRQ